MNFGLEAEEALVLSTVRRFAQKQIAEAAADADRAGEAPAKLLAAAGEIGFFLDAVPADAEGLLEGDYRHVLRALRSLELGRGCAAIAALIESNVEAALAVGRWGSEPARAALFGALAAGKRAVTWRDFAGALQILPRGGGLEVNGKIGPLPGLIGATDLLVCADHASEPVLFLLQVAGENAVPARPSGWRAAAWGSLACDRAVVGEERVLARGAAATAAIAEVLAWYRVSLAARAIGVATAAIEHARRYSRERVQFGQPIGRFEALIRMHDENETMIAAARLLVLEAAWRLDRGEAGAGDTASRARDLAARVVSRATIDAVQVLGGYGFVNDYPVEKLMRDARAFEVLLGNEAFDRVLGELAASAAVT